MPGGGAARRGAMLAMPLLVMNMGGEMVYILEQRLHAQNIPVEKSRKVLTDVVKTMYSGKFMTELFKPQEVYSSASTRQIFDRLAHSSIMRLNKNSMDKLYDLMTMGFKYQMVGCTSPTQLLQVTLNHLDALAIIVKEPSVAKLLEQAREMTIDTYTGLSTGEYYMLKQVLASFFQDRRVKVSLFLQDGTQNLDGTLVQDPTGPVPEGADPPGLVTTYNGDGTTSVSTLDQLVIEGTTPAITGDAMDAKSRPCKLGTNMYKKDRPKKPIPPQRLKRGASTPSMSASGSPRKASSKASFSASRSHANSSALSRKASASSAMAASSGGAGGGAGAYGGSGGGSGSTAGATAGLNLLAGLLGTAADSGSASSSTTLNITNLFAKDIFASDGKESGETVNVITIDAADRETMTEMMSKLGLDENDAATAGGAGGGAGAGGDSKDADDDEDDLLALMDSAM